MRRIVTGDQVAQIRNPDPFAFPIWRAPVYRTPGWIVALAQLGRFIFWLIRLVFRHPVVSLVLAVAGFTWSEAGWLGVMLLAVWSVLVLVCWRVVWPVSFGRWVAAPARSTWRAWRYRRRWASVMTISGLAPWYQGRIILPVLGKVCSTRYVDRVQVRLVSGQSAADVAENLAHGFGALLCRVRTARSGAVVLEFVRRDALARVVRPAPMLVSPDLRALEVGRREDGLPWLVRLHGTHVLVAGATGAGKASLLWGLVRAMFPLMQDGMVRVLAADPKLMELAFGRIIFDTHGDYAADPAAIAGMLERAVADMQARAARFAGFQRDRTPTREHPFTVVLVDEVAFLTAYQPDRKLRERIMNALATLTTQGRAVGYCVVAALQDPRKEVLTIRNLFPDRIAMRLDEPEQTDMVLGDGARDRGAACELISMTRRQVPGWRSSGWNPTRTRCGSAPDGCPMRTSPTWPPGATPTRCRWSWRGCPHDHPDRLGNGRLLPRLRDRAGAAR
jgi:DNA segregation ATPase FtsK/SpoIIIE, S-DNA-T family